MRGDGERLVRVKIKRVASRDLGLPRSHKFTTTVRLTRNYDYYLSLFLLLLLLLFQTRYHQPGCLSFSKGSRTVADMLHPRLGGELYHFPCLSCCFFCLICVHILQLPVPSLLLMSSTLLSTCCRGGGSEALLVSPYVVCSSPLQPYACTGARWQGRLYPSHRPFLSTNLQLTSASDSPPVCTP